ncbi:MAG: hypothetical protein B1H07_03220 [Campylobacteraceae bacterium 4484_166]|nr:MAG: hypothetical protein B1H07_03220 [Campylobacteraceae bacterium 4484_166]
MSAIKFEAILKNKATDGWYIELTDTMENKTVKCDDLDIFSQNIEKMGAEYGNDIEVVWSQDEDVSPEYAQELRVSMMAYQEKYKDEIEQDENNVSSS